MTLSGVTIPSQSGPGNHGNVRVLHIPQISKAGASPPNGLIYLRYLLGGLTEMKLVYSTAPCERATWEQG